MSVATRRLVRLPRKVDPRAVREALAIADVLRSAGVEPPRRGRRMRCPIHGGRNDQSFAVFDDGRRFKCFSCGIAGDAIDLAQRLLGLSFTHALAHCASVAGLSPAACSPSSLRRAVAARGRQRAERAAIEEAFHGRWDAALDELREAQERVELALISSRAGAALAGPTDPFTDELLAHERLSEIEAEWRGWREGGVER